MRHSNSFTHEPLWVVTHTAWLSTIQSSPSEDPAGNQIHHENDERRRQQTTENKVVGRHVLSAMIAVLALSFLTMVATLFLTVRMMPTGARETKGNF